MDRIREARRGNMAAVNGALSRRRQRSSSLRDSPDEDGAMEMQETLRLRDRGSKKDRDRDRSGRNKRRRGDRMMHGSHREEGDDSSEESLDEEDDDDEDDSTVAVRLPPPAAQNPTPTAPVMQNHHLRKGYPVKPARPPGPGAWKVVEEMIGAPIPRKARSSSVKRSQECWLSGGGAAGSTGGGGAGEQIHRQASMSPARPSPTSTTPVSPSSSNVSVRKKVKPISGSKHRLPKSSKSSSIQEIEIEVAEVLFGMTRQVPQKPEDQKHDAKESNGSGNEVKSRVSSPYPISPPVAASQPAPLRSSNQSSSTVPLTATAPKRKRPRLRLDDDSPTSPPSSSVIPATSSSSVAKMDSEPTLPTAANKADAAGSPKSEKKSPVVEDSGVSCDPAISNSSPAAALNAKVQSDSVKPESNLASDPNDLDNRPEKRPKEEAVCSQKESTCAKLDVKAEDAPASKAVLISESQREEKFSFDLMALPGKSSPELECNSDYVADCKSVEMEMVPAPKPEPSKAEGEKTEKKSKTVLEEIILVDNGGKLSTVNSDLSKHGGKEKNLDFQLDLEKLDNDTTGSSKNQSLKQQSRVQRAELKIEKSGPTASSPMPMQITGWPGGFPPFGYMGPVPPLPPVVPVDGSTTSSKAVQSFLPSQLRPKRCAAHCYIAQNIHYHQQITRLNPFWPSAAGAPPLYASKQYNLNTTPPSDSAAILGATLQGGIPGRSLGSVSEKGGQVSVAHLSLSSKDKSNAAAAAAAAAAQYMDTSQRKATTLPQPSQPGSAGNMLAPAFIFPMHQQQASVQPAAVGTPNRSGVAKLSSVSGNVAQSSNSAGYASVGASGANGPGTTMSFNYPGLPANDAQYLAFLQNNAYSFPIPTHVGGAPPFRGTSPAQAMPFFNLSFYPSQMLHPSQIRLQQQPPSQQLPPPYSQQGHQNPSTSSGSSSSQKNTQQTQRVSQPAANAATAGNSHGFPSSKQQHHHVSHQVRQMESEVGGEDAPSTADSRATQAQKGIYTQKFSMPAHAQNFALIAPATTGLSGGVGNHSEKQQQQQQTQNTVMKMDLTPSQAFAMSFTSFSGAAAGGAAPHGLDFSSMAQNHALFQSLPEAARHGYQVSVAAHSAQQRHNKKGDDIKSASDLGNAASISEEGKMSSANKSIGSQQQSLTFSRADAESPQMSSILSNNAIDGSSRTLNLIQQPPNGVQRVSNRPASASPASNSTPNASHVSNSSHMLSQQHHQQQQVLQLQKQHQQLQLQQQLQQQQRAKPSASHNNTNVYADRMPPGNPASSKFPQGLAGFPPALIQGGASSQSGQWKATARAVNPSSAAVAAVAAASPSSSSSTKSQIPLQQQVRGQQPPSHQPHQISFGVSNAKVGGQSVPASTVGSPQNSVSKSSGGSPHSSSAIGKSVPPPSPVLPVVPFQKQATGKNSSSSSNSPLPTGNRNMPSILGNPHISTASQNMGSKPQSSSQQHLQQSQISKQHFPQAQFFFSNAYMQPQTSQSDMVVAAAAGYFQQQQQQRRQTDQQQSQSRQSSAPASTGMLSLGPSSLSLTGGTGTVPDSSKAGAISTQISNNSKSLTPAGLMQHQAQFAGVTHPGPGSAAGSPAASHPLMSYIHAMQSVPLKPDVSTAGEQKPAAGR